jgi:hypothetical protein
MVILEHRRQTSLRRRACPCQSLQPGSEWLGHDGCSVPAESAHHIAIQLARTSCGISPSISNPHPWFERPV